MRKDYQETRAKGFVFLKNHCHLRESISRIAFACFALILLISCKQEEPGNALMPVEKPTWDKFFVVTSDVAYFYQSADLNSPMLETMTKDTESCEIDRVLRWSGVQTPFGYYSENFIMMTDGVCPIIDETDEWYKVIVSDEYAGSQECYVQKSAGRQVTAQPITSEVLANIHVYNWCQATFGLQTEGEYKNICLIALQDEMDGDRLDINVLYDGVLINPHTKSIYICYTNNQKEPLLIENEQYMYLSYNDSLEGEWGVDIDKVIAEIQAGKIDISRLFEVKDLETNYQTISYYIPEVATDKLFDVIVKKSGPNNDADHGMDGF